MEMKVGSKVTYFSVGQLVQRVGVVTEVCEPNPFGYIAKVDVVISNGIEVVNSRDNIKEEDTIYEIING